MPQELTMYSFDFILGFCAPLMMYFALVSTSPRPRRVFRGLAYRFFDQKHVNEQLRDAPVSAWSNEGG